jgi:tetratricopeptide (TPR) repeat protein
MNRRALGLALSLSLAALSGCGTRGAPANDRAHAEAAMAALGTARALHHEADVYEGAGDFDRAAGAMRRVLDLRLPRGFEEAEDVRADAWGRLAELDLRRDRPDESLSHVDEGIRATPRESVLQARLFMVRGQALRALAERAASAGDQTAAARRREEALAALEHSIEVNARILGRLTDGGRR